MEQVLTFDQLPKAVTILTKEVSELKRLLIEKQELTSIELPEQFLTIQEAADFLKLAVPTIYTKVSRNELPVMKRGKRLYFSKSDLMDYLKAGRRKTNEDLEKEVDKHLEKK